jgi:GNAT superfamily N-acetyltransferase
VNAQTIAVQRNTVRRLLDERSTVDALAAYYAFHHDPERTDLFAHTDAVSQRPDGFLVRARTGQDLFRPLVTFRAPTAEVAGELFRAGLNAGRPYYFTIPFELAGYVHSHLAVVEPVVYHVYRLDRSRFEPIINVFVTSSRGADGWPRYEIRQVDRLLASAGVNWRSPRFAELYVHVDPAARGRGYGKSVVARAAADLLEANVTPLYVAAEDNTASLRTAEAVGFSDTGLREYVCEAALLQP